jgi:hypothetical protein
VVFSSLPVDEQGRRNADRANRMICRVDLSNGTIGQEIALGEDAGAIDLFAVSYSADGRAAALAALRDGKPMLGRYWAEPTPQISLYDVQPEGGCAISPDGEKVLFAGKPADQRQSGGLWMLQWDKFQRLEVKFVDPPPAAEPERRPIAPCFSPDGKRIAYVKAPSDGDGFLRGQLRFFSLEENAPQAPPFLRYATDAFDPCFSLDGTRLVFALKRDGERDAELYLLSEGGLGGPRRITNNTTEDARPTFTRDGSALVWAARAPTGTGPSHLATAALDGSAARVLLDQALFPSAPVCHPQTGRIVFRSFNHRRDGSIDLDPPVHVLSELSPGTEGLRRVSGDDLIRDHASVVAVRFAASVQRSLMATVKGKQARLWVSDESVQPPVRLELPAPWGDLEDQRHFGGFDISPDGASVVVCGMFDTAAGLNADGERIYAMWLINVADGSMRKLVEATPAAP